MFAACTTLGSIALVTSLNSRTCSPAEAIVEAAIKLAAPNRNRKKQVRLLRMIILPPCSGDGDQSDHRSTARFFLGSCGLSGTWSPPGVCGKARGGRGFGAV